MRVSNGFTLIELMVAVVIIGLLSAIALPRATRLRDRAYIATLQSDLRNLAAQEESFYYDNAVYTPDPSLLPVFQSSPMVSISVSEATSSGWAATADHALSGVQCAVYVGNAAPVGAATLEGQIACQ